MKDEEHRLIIQAKEGNVEAFAQLVAACDEIAQPVDDGMPVRYAPLRYVISETRIMKSGETRYYDYLSSKIRLVVDLYDRNWNLHGTPCRIFIEG